MRVFSVTIKKRDGKIRQMRYIRMNDLPPEVIQRNIGYGKIEHKIKIGEIPKEEENARVEQMYENREKIQKSIPKTKAVEKVWDVEKNNWRSLMYERIIEGPILESDIPMPHEIDLPRESYQAIVRRNTITYINFAQNFSKFHPRMLILGKEKKERYENRLTEQKKAATIKVE